MQKLEQNIPEPMLLKKVKLNEESSCSQTLLNENSNSSLFEGKECKENKIKQILTLPSLRERFGMVINDPSKSQYSVLPNRLLQIDSTLLLLKQRCIPSFWSDVQKYCNFIVQTMDLQHILSLWPEAYNVSMERWEKQHNKYELLIKLPLQSRDRKQHLQQLLDDHLQINGDYIKLFELPTICEQIELINTQHQQIQEFKCNLEQSINIGDIGKQLLPQKEGEISKLAQRLIDKLKQNKQEKYQNQTEYKIKGNVKIQVQIAQILHQYYNDRNVSNMFMDNVKKYILSANKKIMLNNAQIELNLKSIIDTTKGWLTILETQDNKILRMNRTMSFPSIISYIQSNEQ